MAIKIAQDNIKAQQVRQKPYYDKGRRDLTFQKGDLVLKRSHYHSDKDAYFMAKLAPKWQGPFKIFEVCSRVTMRLCKVNTDKVLEGTYHVQDLKPYVPGLAEVMQESSDDESDEDVSPTHNLRPRGQTQGKLREAVKLLRGKRQ